MTAIGAATSQRLNTFLSALATGFLTLGMVLPTLPLTQTVIILLFLTGLKKVAIYFIVSVIFLYLKVV
jgi:hypothetical protein